MDYEAIDSFMKSSGLAKEPAFDYLHVMTAQIPAMRHSTVLGLYFPDGDESPYFGHLPPSTTVLPSECDVHTVLHELGHRYGHYYFNDISEPFAEAFRAREEKRLGIEDEMEQFAARQVTEADICPHCPEMEDGKSKVCIYCEYGGKKKDLQAARIGRNPAPLIVKPYPSQDPQIFTDIAIDTATPLHNPGENVSFVVNVLNTDYLRYINAHISVYLVDGSNNVEQTFYDADIQLAPLVGIGAGWNHTYSFTMPSHNVSVRVVVGNYINGVLYLDNTQDSFFQISQAPPLDLSTYSLIYSKEYPANATYQGQAQRGYIQYSYLPSNWPNTQWLQEELLYGHLADQVALNGETILTVKTYNKGTQYIFVVEATQTNQVAGLIVPNAASFAWAALPWGTIVVAAIILIILIVVAVVVLKTESFIKGLGNQFGLPGLALGTAAILGGALIIVGGGILLLNAGKGKK